MQLASVKNYVGFHVFMCISYFIFIIAHSVLFFRSRWARSYNQFICYFLPSLIPPNYDFKPFVNFIIYYHQNEQRTPPIFFFRSISVCEGESFIYSSFDSFIIFSQSHHNNTAHTKKELNIFDFSPFSTYCTQHVRTHMGVCAFYILYFILFSNLCSISIPFV